MPTANFNLPIYGPGDTAALDTLLNGQSNAIDAALLATEWRAGGTDAQRLALASPRRKEGLTFYATDTNREWIYDGAAWQPNDGDGYLLRPATVTGGTVDATGAIIPTAGVSTISMDFGSAVLARFRAIHFKFFLEPTASGSPAFQFRRAGVALAAAASYGNQRQFSNGATRSSDYVTGTFADLGVSAQEVTSGELTIFNPGEAATRKTWIGTLFQGPVNPNNVQIAGHKSDAEAQAALDGFAITFGAGTFKSGSKNFIKAYGQA